jgi:signal transduction histidine kinase
VRADDSGEMSTLSTEPVIVLAQLGRDGAIIAENLNRAGITTNVVRDFNEFLACIQQEVSVALLTQESLNRSDIDKLQRALADQPSWSELPVQLLLSASRTARTSDARDLAALTAAHGVVVHQRPIPTITLVTAIRSAQGSRRRQFQVRDLLMRERLAREQAEAATRVKDELLAVISHELRTPVSSILMWANLLVSGGLTEEQLTRGTRAVLTCAQVQSQLIEDLLDIARMLTGKLRVQTRPLALGPILETAADTVRPMATAKNVQLELAIDDSPMQVLVDLERIHQVFWNLLSNAVKFTPVGGKVSLRLIEESEQVCVVIADTGQGIPAELLPHVFERFQQGDQGIARHHGGLGLGLYIARQLVELHGGAIAAVSNGTGTGATFTVRLPVASEY